MKPGPKPIPKNVRILRGNPSKRALPENIPEPELVVVVPEPPEQLSLVARPHWNQFAEQLAKMRVLSDADYPALCMLCESYAVYWEAMDGVREYGIMSITPNQPTLSKQPPGSLSAALTRSLWPPLDIWTATESGLRPPAGYWTRAAVPMPSHSWLPY